MKKLIVALVIASSVAIIASCESKLGGRYDITKYSSGVMCTEFSIDTFDDSGVLNIRTSGKHISLAYSTSDRYHSDGSWVSESGKQDSLDILVDDMSLNTDGETCLIYEKELKPSVIITEDELSGKDLSIGLINSLKTKVTGDKIVIIKTDSKIPLYIFSGDDITHEDKGVFNLTTITIDGRTLYMQNGDYQILDTALL
jgi:hypothetical protein